MKKANKTPTSNKRREPAIVSVRVLEQSRAGVIALGQPPEKEPPPPG
jgi:hypothetical protein